MCPLCSSQCPLFMHAWRRVHVSSLQQSVPSFHARMETCSVSSLQQSVRTHGDVCMCPPCSSRCPLFTHARMETCSCPPCSSRCPLFTHAWRRVHASSLQQSVPSSRTHGDVCMCPPCSSRCPLFTHAWRRVHASSLQQSVPSFHARMETCACVLLAALFSRTHGDVCMRPPCSSRCPLFTHAWRRVHASSLQPSFHARMETCACVLLAAVGALFSCTHGDVCMRPPCSPLFTHAWRRVHASSLQQSVPSFRARMETCACVLLFVHAWRRVHVSSLQQSVPSFRARMETCAFVLLAAVSALFSCTHGDVCMCPPCSSQCPLFMHAWRRVHVSSWQQ